eukprot:4721987-Alexandrium_andersonii.AAC.1
MPPFSRPALRALTVLAAARSSGPPWAAPAARSRPTSWTAGPGACASLPASLPSLAASAGGGSSLRWPSSAHWLGAG